MDNIQSNKIILDGSNPNSSLVIGFPVELQTRLERLHEGYRRKQDNQRVMVDPMVLKVKSALISLECPDKFRVP